MQSLISVSFHDLQPGPDRGQEFGWGRDRGRGRGSPPAPGPGIGRGSPPAPGPGASNLAGAGAGAGVGAGGKKINSQTLFLIIDVFLLPEMIAENLTL